MNWILSLKFRSNYINSFEFNERSEVQLLMVLVLYFLLYTFFNALREMMRFDTFNWNCFCIKNTQCLFTLNVHEKQGEEHWTRAHNILYIVTLTKQFIHIRASTVFFNFHLKYFFNYKMYEIRNNAVSILESFVDTLKEIFLAHEKINFSPA